MSNESDNESCLTDDTLAILEALAAKATPDPWVWKGPDEPADLWTADGKDAIVCVSTTNHDIRFIQAMRKYAQPMLALIRNLQAQLEYARELTCLTTVVGCGECQLCTAQRELLQARDGLATTKVALENAIDASAEGAWMARALDAERELKGTKALIRGMEGAITAMTQNYNDAVAGNFELHQQNEALRKERDDALTDAAWLQKSIDNLVKEQEMNAKAWREVQQQSRPNQWDKNKF